MDILVINLKSALWSAHGISPKSKSAQSGWEMDEIVPPIMSEVSKDDKVVIYYHDSSL